MSDWADYYSIRNSVDIRELRTQQQQQMRVSEFNERGSALQRETGVVAKGFFTLERENPTPREKSKSAKWVLGVVAGILAASFAPSILVIAGVAALGFVGGSFMPESETVRMDRALNKYEAYFNQVEVSAHAKTRTLSVSHDMGPEADLNLRTDHAQNVLAEREAQQGHENARTA